MGAVYLDTSVLGRVLLDEPDAPAIRRALGRFDRHISSRLLGVELRRLGQREDVLVHAEELLSGKLLIPMDEELLASAETLTPSAVATLDAIHLATAIRLAGEHEVDAIMTYDRQLAAGAEEHGMTVVSPS